MLISLALTGCGMVQYNDSKTVSTQSDAWYGLDNFRKQLIMYVSSMVNLKQYIHIVQT